LLKVAVEVSSVKKSIDLFILKMDPRFYKFKEPLKFLRDFWFIKLSIFNLHFSS
jgi:hypothetical protein